MPLSIAVAPPRVMAPETRTAILERFRSGSISAETAIVELMLSEKSAAGVILAAADEPALARIARAHAARLPHLIELALSFDHHPAAREEDPIEAVRRFFELAVDRDEAASAGLYTLGDARTLERATAELVALLDARALLDPAARVLDLGCGAGRIAFALARRVRSIAGIDLAQAMIDRARRRCAGLANVAFARGDARDLGAFESESFELALAVDSFPYLVRAGSTYAREACAAVARVLRRGGRFLIFNFAYGSDPAARVREVGELARAAGFAPIELGSRPFALWDAELHDLVRV